MKKIAQYMPKIKIINFFVLTLAGSINALGVTLFLYPVKLYDSGISGVSMLLDQLTPSNITMAIFLLVLNVPIFLFGLKKQGTLFTIYSVYAVAIYSLGAYLIMNVLPINVDFVSPLAGSDLLLCAIFGGAISGIGSGLTIRYGGAIDGIDVLSVIFAKRIGLSVGSFIMIFNLALYIVCGFVLSSWILPLYSIITYFVASRTIDFIVEGFDRAKCAMIVTTKADEITSALTGNFDSSGTIVDALGGYSKTEFKIIYLIINHFQINKLKTIVHNIDKKAFISLHEITDVIKQ